MNLFVGSDEKVKARKLDREIIEEFVNIREEPLDYLGLGGPRLEDVKEWLDYLGNIEVVERNHEAYLTIQEEKARLGLGGKIKSKNRDINKVLLEDKEVLDFPFQVVNLDYVGPPTPEEFEAISELIEAQRKEKCEKFLLFATFLGHRSRESAELKNQLRDLRGIVRRKKEKRLIKKIIKEGKQHEKMLFVIPYQIAHSAGSIKYELNYNLLLTYVGSKGGSRILHYSMTFESLDRKFSLFDPETIKELFETPIKEVHGDEVEDFNFSFQ